MVLLTAGLALLAAPLVLADWVPFQPPGTPFPDTTYPNATDPNAVPGAQSFQTSPPFYPSPWGEGMGDWAAAYAKAQAFVSQLTLLEKVNLTTGVGWQSDRCVGNAGEIPRLNFRGFCLQDSPLGVRDTDFNSGFGAGVMVAATWDRSLMYARGAAMAAEHRDKGVDMQLGPVVGPLGRVPEGGRNWEGFSPDPVLSGIAVAQTIQGMQSQNVMACTKHFILNEQEHFRTPGGAADAPDLGAISSNIDDVTMHELYLWPFADAVRAGTAAIMCSYQQVNNSHACQNSAALNGLLKAELGFQGMVVSDWSATHSGVASVLAGLDMTMPGDIAFNTGTTFFGTNLTVGILNGTIPQYRLDDMAVRIMAAYYYVGRDTVDTEPNFSAWTLATNGSRYFYSGTDNITINEHVNVQADHAQGVREIGAKGTVLLKNSGVLPLNAADIKLTGVFGEDAGPNVWGPNGCADSGCDNGTLAMGWGSGTANFPYLITPGHAIENGVRAAGQDIEMIYQSYADAQIELLASRVNDVGGACIVFSNADAGEDYITVDNNQGDRNNLTLWAGEEALVSMVASQCSNTIVVLHTVGPVLVTDWYQNPNITAILWGGIPGQESGNSIADVLYGSVNPSGKLPFTMGSYRGEYGADIIYLPNEGNTTAPQANFQEGNYIDYRVFDKLNVTPIYEFGYGLSYTTFSYSNLAVVPVAAPAYTPASGDTAAAPTFGTIDTNVDDAQYPAGFTPLFDYIYPFLNSTDLSTASMDPYYGTNVSYPDGATSSSPQPRLPASGAPGGNPGLYDVLYVVAADVTNTGSIAGEEVAQLYISLGGNNPPVVLRNFDKQSIAPGQTVTYSFEIVRRDVSNWDSAAQNWVITSYPKTVYVGSSSRKLPLSAPLMGGDSGGGGAPSSSSSSGSASPPYPTTSATSESMSGTASYSMSGTAPGTAPGTTSGSATTYTSGSKSACPAPSSYSA